MVASRIGVLCRKSNRKKYQVLYCTQWNPPPKIEPYRAVKSANRSLFCSAKLHLFNQKYSKNSHIEKYYLFVLIDWLIAFFDFGRSGSCYLSCMGKCCVWANAISIQVILVKFSFVLFVVSFQGRTMFKCAALLNRKHAIEFMWADSSFTHHKFSSFCHAYFAKQYLDLMSQNQFFSTPVYTMLTIDSFLSKIILLYN